MNRICPNHALWPAVLLAVGASISACGSDAGGTSEFVSESEPEAAPELGPYAGGGVPALDGAPSSAGESPGGTPAVDPEPGADSTPDDEPAADPGAEGDLDPGAPGDPAESPDPPDNQPPEGGSALVQPATAYEGDTIACLASGAVDPEGETVVWTYEWTINGSIVPNAVDSTLSSAYFDKGDAVGCIATPHDSQLAGLPVVSKTDALVLNTPPAVAAANLIPALAPIDGAFVCSFSGWSDPDPTDAPAGYYSWQRLTSAGAVTIPSEFTAQLAASVVGPGAQVRCLVTPYDDEAVGPTVQSPVGFVAAPAEPECVGASAQFDLGVAVGAPKLLFVIDRSGSMYEHWSATQNALGDVIAGLGPDAESGLILYPSQSGCSIATQPQVPLGANQGGAIVTAMAQAGTSGSTPMGKAMKGALAHLTSLGSAATGTAVVLVADGKPSDTCLEDCTGCDCTDASICLWCADLIECTNNEVRASVESLEALGHPTYVIGFGGGFGATDFLISLAESGGTAGVGDAPYFDAGSGTTLAQALSAVAEDVTGCTFEVSPPAIYDEVVVTLNGAPVPHDPSHANGWDLSSAGSLTLHGAACPAPGADAVVDVTFGCTDE